MQIIITIYDATCYGIIHKNEHYLLLKKYGAKEEIYGGSGFFMKLYIDVSENEFIVLHMLKTIRMVLGHAWFVYHPANDISVRLEKACDFLGMIYDA